MCVCVCVCTFVRLLKQSFWPFAFRFVNYTNIAFTGRDTSYRPLITKKGGEYLTQLAPDEPSDGEKSVLKQAQQIVRVLEENDSLDCLQVLAGDSTSINTEQHGGVHACTDRETYQQEGALEYLPHSHE